MNAHRIELAHAIYQFCRSCIESLAATGDVMEDFDTSYREVGVAAALMQLRDCAEGLSYEREDSALFEAMLLAGGHCEAECAEARHMRQAVIEMADVIVSHSGLRWR